MKKMIYFGAILILTMLATNAFAQDTMDKDMKMNGKKSPDSKFMMTLATGGANEITLSRTALSKSSNDSVKEFAQKMVDDHTAAGDELKTLAESKGVMVSDTPDAKHTAMNEKLSGMSGSDFDMQYMKTMVGDHEKTVALLRKEADSGKDADAKALAAKLLPIVQGHLDMAKSIMNDMSGKKSMKTDSMTDNN